ERAGVDHEIADPLWRALGFPDVAPEEPAYTEEDIRALQIAAKGIPSLEGHERERALELIVREARTVSGHLARIAEQQVDVLPQLQAMGLRQHSVAEALERGLERSRLGWLIMYGLRRLLDEAVRRRAATESGPEPEPVVVRGGDYFGPVVNLASRLVDVAAPDMVVVDEGYRRVLGEQDASVSFEALESQDLKGIGDTEMWRLDRPVPPIV